MKWMARIMVAIASPNAVTNSDNGGGDGGGSSGSSESESKNKALFVLHLAMCPMHYPSGRRRLAVTSCRG